MTIRVTINNRAVRPECITVTEPRRSLRERELDMWHERFKNWLAASGDLATVSAAEATYAA